MQKKRITCIIFLKSWTLTYMLDFKNSISGSLGTATAIYLPEKETIWGRKKSQTSESNQTSKWYLTKINTFLLGKARKCSTGYKKKKKTQIIVNIIITIIVIFNTMITTGYPSPPEWRSISKITITKHCIIHLNWWCHTCQSIVLQNKTANKTKPKNKK